MNQTKYQYIYGPVYSWRLGMSLGIDLLSQKEKICTFDCLYCQVGRNTGYPKERKIYVSTSRIIEELNLLPQIKIDYITFSGRGEPTLAKNLGEVIKAVKELRKEPIAVLTNSSLIDNELVRRELSLADFVICKIDACSQELLEKIDNPVESIKFEEIVNALKQFRKEYPKKLALQVMFIEENKDKANELAQLSKKIEPDEIQINTPLRKSGAKPLSTQEIETIKECFKKICSRCPNIITVYEGEQKEVYPISMEETLKRRSKINEKI